MNRQQEKANRCASSSTSTTNNASSKKNAHSQGAKVSSWNSGSSKFSRILNNLEKSILNQFNTSTSNSNTISRRLRTSKESLGAPKSTSKLNDSPTSDKVILQQNNKRCSSNEQKLQQQQQQQHSSQFHHKCESQELKNVDNKSISIKLQQQQQTTTRNINRAANKLLMDTNRGKMTLNKQEQCVGWPSLRTINNHPLELNTSNSISSNKINNHHRLSIPPPHANNEARNQNHRLIFGADEPAASANHQVVPFDSVNKSTQLDRCAQFSSSTSRINIIKLDDDDDDDVMNNTLTPPILPRTTNIPNIKTVREINSNQPNLSPALSAKSLPTFKLAAQPKQQQQQQQQQQKYSPNRSHEVTTDDEEAGFSTYQSRRSLAAPNSNLNTSNMIMMRTSQLPMLTSVTTTSYSPQANCIPPQQQQPQQHFLYQYQPHQQYIASHQHQHQQQQHQQQHPLHHQQQQLQQHQLFSSNQVPILQQHPNNQTASMTSTTTSLNQPRISNTRMFNDTHQVYPTHNIYAGLPVSSSTGMIPVAYVDNSQEIYANAPPKPRRYQYYDQNLIFQHHMIPQTTTQTNAISTSNSDAHFNQHQQFNQICYPYQQPQHQYMQKQQFMPNQHMYNISYLHQVPRTSYPNQQLQQPNEQTTFNQNISNFQHQQPVNLPHPMIKSKSSLDASDLLRFKLNKVSDNQNLTQTLRRLQPTHNSSNLQQHKPYSPQQFIYNSQVDQINALVPQPNGYHPKAYVNSSMNVPLSNPGANSHLIVDLTTPRVLAKTQTTLLSSSPRLETKRGESYTYHQNGAPQIPNRVAPSLAPKPSQSQSQPQPQSQLQLQQQQPQQQQQQQPVPNESNLQAPYRLLVDKRAESSATNQQPSTFLERSAPYYYSDLKSEEQRQALLTIVQQKSLSPPPQLLSRSADQSSTRLAPKSATLHHSMNSKLFTTHSPTITKSSLKSSQSAHDVSSTTNITKNIDKLFETPAQSTMVGYRINTVQSMLSLNDTKIILSNGSSTNSNNKASDSSDLSSFPTNSESTSIGYFSGETRSKNFSKSKSLQNLLLNDEVDGGRKLEVPVYENIRRSDKLMNALNSSTTCLSTLRSRAHSRKTKVSSEAASAAVVSSGGLGGGERERERERERGKTLLNNNDLIRAEDDDFIEFLSSPNGTSCLRSQFEASQFSASDFNTSTSASESSASGAGNDLPSSSPSIISSSTAVHMFMNGTRSGTLKKSHLVNSSASSNSSSRSSNSSSASSSSSSSDIGGRAEGSADVSKSNNNNNEKEKDINISEANKHKDGKFNNVLGNVIDVDMYPMSKLSHSSPVNNKA